jgi:hypothetical protein
MREETWNRVIVFSSLGGILIAAGVVLIMLFHRRKA